MSRAVAVTGIGMITPLGTSADEVLARLRAGDCAAARPSGFDPGAFACRVCAEVKDFDPQRYVPEPKTMRMMNRDALLAVAAAGLALLDAGVTPGSTYPAEGVGLFGATGMAGIALSEVGRLVEGSAGEGGEFDPRKFGEVALKHVRPVLSFKILSNMAMCFVSIFHNLQGPNAIYNPWEGHGARAIAAGMRAIARGEAECVLAGGCDVKTHELGFIGLHQCGAMRSWEESGAGAIPGEGAAFVVLEAAERAAARGARVYGRLESASVASSGACELALARFAHERVGAIVCAADGDPGVAQREERALVRCEIAGKERIAPKKQLGNLYAAAAAVQVGLAAAMTPASGRVLANCFGHGSEQAAFLLRSA